MPEGEKRISGAWSRTSKDVISAKKYLGGKNLEKDL